MPNLGALNTVTVTGKYVFLDDQVATSGTVTFEAVGVDLREPAANLIILGTPIAVAVGAQGTFSIALPATDDPDVTPTGFVYKVTEAIPHPVTAVVRGRTFNIQVPVDSPGGTLDLADVAAAESVTPSVQYTLQATHNTHVAAADPHSAAGYVLADGTRAFTGDVDLGSNKLVNVADPENAQDAATRAWVTGRLYTALVGDGIADEIGIPHGLNTPYPIWQLFEEATGEKVLDNGRKVDDNNLHLSFQDPPGAGEFRIVVIGLSV